MNLNQASNNSISDRFINLQANSGVRPVGMVLNNTPQPRHFRPEQPHSDGRSENIYHQNYMNQQQTQQNIMQQRQYNMLQQQQNLRFSPDGIRSHFRAAQISQPNGGAYNNKRGLVAPYERFQMPPQSRFPGAQHQMHPPPDSHVGVPLTQLNLQNYQRMEAPKSSNNRIQTNLQRVPENHRSSAPIDITKKFSEFEINPQSTLSNNQELNKFEKKPSSAGQPENFPNSSWGEKKLDVPKPPIHSSAADSKSEYDQMSQNSNESKKTDLEDRHKVINAGTNSKEKNQKIHVKNTVEGETIVRGTVKKNIKFFEENDKTKTPLKPETKIVEKNKKTVNIPKDVIKSDTRRNEYESGVDETPVIHPNLRSIYQIPRKVAKIPYSSTNRFSKKLKYKEGLNKKQVCQAPKLNEFLRPGSSYLPYKAGVRKTQKMKTYSSNEELLAFFENTKSWRKLNRYDYKADQKDKIHNPTTNGDIPTPKKTSKLQTPSKKGTPVSPTKTPVKSPGTPVTSGLKSLPKTPDSSTPTTPLIKKVPMNKIQVGAAPSPNLKTVKSKVGSLVNTTHKPGGGNVKIESHKIDLSNVQPKTEAKNDQYKPSGGEKKIQQVKLQWSAKSKVGSLENATYKPKGGDKKIETVKLDFKEKAKSKVGSKDNVKHTPGGGNVKIENQKLEFKAQSKVGSLDNVKHKPGGGDIKIFDDKTYLRQISATSSEGRASGAQDHNLSVAQEVEEKSMPGLPGKNTKYKKHNNNDASSL